MTEENTRKLNSSLDFRKGSTIQKNDSNISRWSSASWKSDISHSGMLKTLELHVLFFFIFMFIH